MGSSNITRVKELAINNDKRQMGLVIDEDIIFTANSGKEYIIYGTELFEFGGDATLYFCEASDSGNSEKLIAKIYDNIPAAKFNNEYLKFREDTAKLIMENSDYKTKHLLPILDYGYMEYEMGNAVNPEFFVEIIPYCENGDLDGKQISFKELKEKLIPEINEALNCIHSYNLVHRDIKPSNIFLYNGSYVLGDFGAMSPIGKDGSHITITIKISYGYAPLEALSGVIVTPTDYYAFGMTIATLYAGKYIFKGLDDDTSASTVLEVQKALKDKHLPISFPNKEEKKLENLIIGLLINDFNKRYDYKEVKLWLSGKSTRKETEDSTFNPPFKGIHGECHDFEELYQYLNMHWDEADRYIIEKKSLERFIERYNSGMALKISDVVKSCTNKKISSDTAISQVLNLIYPEVLCYKGYEFKEFTSLIEHIYDEKFPSDTICKDMLSGKLLSWWLKRLKDKNKDKEGFLSLYNDVLPKIEKIENVASKYPTLAFGLFIDSLESRSENENSKIMTRIYHGINPDEVFDNFKEKLDYFKDYSTLREKSDMMLAFLSAYISEFSVSIQNETIHFKDVVEFRDNYESFEDNQKIYTILLCLFEKICSDKANVREHFVNHGPFACYMWIKNNLKVYSENPNGTIIRAINDMTFDFNKPIVDLYNQQCVLESYVYNIRRGIQMQIMHFKNLNDVVSLASDDGRFVDNMFGKHIAAGFYDTIKK